MLRGLTMLLSVLFIGAVLEAEGDEFGAWESLFNGKDTSGWVGAKTNQKGAWKAADGALTNVGSVGLDLCTEKEFDNYELEIEYKVALPPEHRNSGVYLRGQIEVQIDDSFGQKKLESGNAGGIYSRFAPKANPQKPAGEWNQFRMRHLGNNISVWHNGVLIHDNVFVDSPTGGPMTESMVPKRKGERLDISRGPIMLQGDHGPIWFRNIRIRPFCSPQDGWKSLWNGKDLSEFNCGGKIDELWELDKAAGGFTNKKWYEWPTKEDRGADLRTKGEFANFLVHWEYKSDPKIGTGNSGFYLRDQWEIQINKEQSTTNKHGDGALYDRFPPRVAASNPPGEWNSMDAKVEGMKVWVWQNGKLLHEAVELLQRTDSPVPATDATKPQPFKLQGDHDKVWFRNLFVKPLKT